jgi:hypothetical protein
MAIRKRLGALAMAAMLPFGGATVAFVIMVSTATPVAAACWDRGCNTLDPQSQGCSSNAYSVYTVPIKDSGGTTLGTLELRYSRTCGANWSRVTAYPQFAGAVQAVVHNNVGDTPQGTCYETSTFAYSCMLGGAAEQDYAEGWITWQGSGGYAKTPWG